MSEAVVELRDVFCVHRTGEGDAAALQGIDLELPRGEVLCVLGPSGAGKSTLLRVIAGIQTPSAGIVRVLGRDIGRLPTRARASVRHDHLGFLGQHSETALPPDLSVHDAVALPLALRGVPARARRARAQELLDAAGLHERRDALPDQLSGGERQRLALCASLAHRPALLLADEPTGELDEASAQVVRKQIGELARSRGTSVILVSHDVASAAIADRVVRIRDGRVVEDRRDGETAFVVGRGGRLQLPSELLQEAGIAGRVRVRRSADGLLVTPVAGEPRATGRPRTAMSRTSTDDFGPAQVELNVLSRSFGRGPSRRLVLDALTLAIAPGRMTVVTGRSGTGKTTMLRLICGLDRPSSGQLLIDEQPLQSCGSEELAALRRRRIGYMPQEPAPVGFLSALEDVALVLRIRGCGAQAAVERAAAALARVGLAERAGQRVWRLSAGEAQRAALARALASARGLLVVDEPTSRLDEANAGTVADLLASAAADDGQTVLCATHDPQVISRADHVVTLAG